MGKLLACVTKPKKYIAIEFASQDIKEIGDALIQYGATIRTQSDGVYVSTIIGNTKINDGDFILINELKIAFVYSRKEFEFNFDVKSEH